MGRQTVLVARFLARKTVPTACAAGWMSLTATLTQTDAVTMVYAYPLTVLAYGVIRVLTLPGVIPPAFIYVLMAQVRSSSRFTLAL